MPEHDDKTEETPADQVGADRPQPGDGGPEANLPQGDETPEPEVFPRSYVEELRAEAAAHRIKARRADDLAREVFALRVSALAKLADPTDLPYDEALLEDAAALETAVDELLTRKPHLAARRPRGDIGQGATATEATADLAGMLRARAV